MIENITNLFTGLFFMALMFGLYFLPSINAYWSTYHQNRKSILMLNLFLGWTFIGWVIALVWSYKK